MTASNLKRGSKSNRAGSRRAVAIRAIAADCANGEFDGNVRTYEREYSYAIVLYNVELIILDHFGRTKELTIDRLL